MTSPIATQDRLKAILTPFLPGVEILTQKPANIEHLLKAALGKLGYVVLISVPGGRRDGSAVKQAVLKQTYRITLVQSGLYKGDRILLDDMMTAVGAVQGEPVVADGKGPLTFDVAGHELDSSESGLNIQHVDVEIKVVVPKPTLPPAP